MRAAAWVLGRVLRVAVLTLAAAAVVFWLLSLSPIDPLTQNVGQNALGSMSTEQIARLRAYWGTDLPAYKRFFSWLFGVMQGDWGTSLLYRSPVSQLIADRFWASAGLLAASWLLSGLLGFLLGIAAAVLHQRLPGRLLHGAAVVLACTPAFWIGLALLLVFAVWLGVLPIGFSAPVGVSAHAVTFADRLHHAVLPAAALTIAGLPSIMLHTRAKALEALRSEAVWFARAQGLAEHQIILRHVMRAAAVPAAALHFAALGELIGASVLTEQVFSYPGLGQAAVAAGLGGDFPLLLGITVLCSAMVFTANMAGSLVCAQLDPRLRREMRL